MTSVPLGYGDPVARGRISFDYKVIPYTMSDGTTMYDLVMPPALAPDELFETIQEAIDYAGESVE